MGDIDGDGDIDLRVLGMDYRIGIIIEGDTRAMPDPAWFTMWFTCDQVGVWNWMRWCSPEFDKLHQEGITSIDPAKRDRLYAGWKKAVERSRDWEEH